MRFYLGTHFAGPILSLALAASALMAQAPNEPPAPLNQNFSAEGAAIAPTPPSPPADAPSLAPTPQAAAPTTSGDCAHGNCSLGSGGATSGCPSGNCGHHGGQFTPVASAMGGAYKVVKHPISGAVGYGDCNYRNYGPHDLFRPYYAPNNCGGPAAALYPAPHPVPAHVGHVYYTYQPLYPHEFLYPHSRTYHRYYDDGRGLTRTKVTWMR